MIIKYCAVLLVLLFALVARGEPGFTTEIKSNGQLWLTVTNPVVGGNYLVEKTTNGTSYEGYVPLGQTTIGGKPVFVFQGFPAGALVRMVEITNSTGGLVTNLSSVASFVVLKGQVGPGGSKELTLHAPPNRPYVIQSAPTVTGPWTDRIIGAVGQTNFIDNQPEPRFYRAKFVP